MLSSPESWATLGGGIALAGGVIGSAIGIAIAGSAGLATLATDSKHFRNVIILASIPMSQTFYGLITFILILTVVVPRVAELGGGNGFAVFACGTIAAFAFCFSAIWKGDVLASGIAMLP